MNGNGNTIDIIDDGNIMEVSSADDNTNNNENHDQNENKK